MAKLMALTLLFVTLALAAAAVEAAPHDSDDEPRVDDEVDLLGLSDGALDEDDYDEDVSELDRADETEQQADPSDRRSYRRRCPRGYLTKRTNCRRVCRFKHRKCTRCLVRCVPRSGTDYLVLGGTRYTVTRSR